MSFGINDEIAATDTTEFVTKTTDWIRRIRETLNQPAPILMTGLPPTYSTFERQVQTIVDNDRYAFFIPGSSLPLDNAAH